MKAFISLVLLVAVAKAGVVPEVMPIHPEIEPNLDYTEEEWEQIYKNQEYTPENYPDYVPGYEPQPETAGKILVEDLEEPRIPDGRIITGSTAARGQIPWQAILILSGSGLCGGSLISTTVILSAAHCIRGQTTYQVTLGSTSRTTSQTGTHTQTSRTGVVHGSYNPNTIANDIALVRITAVALSSYINVVQLPRSSQVSNTFSGLTARVSGFGRISSSNTQTSSNLLFADVSVITNAQCSQTFGTSVLASNICTLGTGGRSPCNGDSGGPLTVNDGGSQIQVGIVSFGRANCPANTPAAFVRVTSFLQWISSNAGISIRP